MIISAFCLLNKIKKGEDTEHDPDCCKESPGLEGVGFSNTCYKERVPQPDLEEVRNIVVYIVYIDSYIYLCHMILIFHLG